MILYVNGDSHTAAAEAVNAHAFAQDDPAVSWMRRLPHPANLAVSWGRLLADTVKATFRCDAESAASNDRILRTTQAWLDLQPRDPDQIMVIIQWSTWERQEWLIDGEYYQVNASGQDQVPDHYQDRYKQWILDIDWTQCQQHWHDRIWHLHQDLDQRNIRHVFFNGNNWFDRIPQAKRLDWGTAYIGPYDAQMTYNQWLLDHDHDTVAPNSWHFGREAHAAWSRFMLQYVINNRLIS